VKHARTTDDRPIHTLYLTLCLILVALLAWSLSTGAIAPAAAPTSAPAPTATPSPCWHPPLRIDQPSIAVCSMRIPSAG